MEVVYMDKESLKFVVLCKKATHTGTHESFSLTEDLNEATLFVLYQRVKFPNADEYLKNDCVQLPAKAERKVTLL